MNQEDEIRTLKIKLNNLKNQLSLLSREIDAIDAICNKYGIPLRTILKPSPFSVRYRTSARVGMLLKQFHEAINRNCKIPF